MILFVSTDATWCRYVRAHLPPLATVRNSPIDAVLQDRSIVRPLAVVTPANSCGYMGGGFDRLILLFLAESSPDDLVRLLEQKLQQAAAGSLGGYLPVSTATVVDLGAIGTSFGFDYLVLTPSMVVPEPLSPELAKQQIFDCVWNSLLAAKNAPTKVETVIVPAFGTSWGQVDSRVSASATVAAAYLSQWPTPDVSGLTRHQCNLVRASLALKYLDKDVRKFGVKEHVEELLSVRELPAAKILLDFVDDLNDTCEVKSD